MLTSFGLILDNTGPDATTYNASSDVTAPILIGGNLGSVDVNTSSTLSLSGYGAVNLYGNVTGMIQTSGSVYVQDNASGTTINNASSVNGVSGGV